MQEIKKDIWGDLPQERRDEVLTYVRTGKASPEFLAYLDQKDEVVRRIDSICEQMVNALKEIPQFPTPPPIIIACSSCGTERPNKCYCKENHIAITCSVFIVLAFVILTIFL